MIKEGVMILEKGTKVRITKCVTGAHNGEFGIIESFGCGFRDIYANVKLRSSDYGLCATYSVEPCPAVSPQSSIASELRNLADRLEAGNG